MKYLAFALCLTVPAIAQTSTPKGAIAGTLFDSIGDPIANNEVQAENAESHGVFKATTSAKGKYTLDLPPGKYFVAASAPGLAPFAMRGVIVKASLTLKFDIHLGDTTQLNTLGEDRLRITADTKRHAPPSGPAPRTFDGKPDLSGVWWIPRTVDPGKPEFLPPAIAIQKQRLEANSKDSPQARCLPSAPLRNGPLWEFVQSKDYLVYISDDESPGFHQIYLDGRPHPADPNPAWYGHSIGRWEGDTLVVDTIAFNDKTELPGGFRHTEALHVVEHFRRIDFDHLQWDATIEDPNVFTKPWTMSRTFPLRGDLEKVDEYVCENNRDYKDLFGK